MRIKEHGKLILLLTASSALFAQSNDFPVTSQRPSSIPDVRQIVESSVAATLRSWQGRLSDVPPGVALPDATSQDAALPGAPLPGFAPHEETTKNAAAPCLEPPPLLRWQDYQGPFQKVVGIFAGKLELKSAHPPHYKPGTVLCSLEVKDKFMLFVRDTFDPISFLAAGLQRRLGSGIQPGPHVRTRPRGLW